jgi:hypothetical protein
VPAGHLHVGFHLTVEDAELLIGRRGACGCGAAGDPVPPIVERSLAHRLAVHVPNRSAVSVTRVGVWKPDRFEARDGDAVEPVALRNLDVDEVVLLGLVQILYPVRVSSQLVLYVQPR